MPNQHTRAACVPGVIRAVQPSCRIDSPLLEVDAERVCLAQLGIALPADEPPSTSSTRLEIACPKSVTTALNSGRMGCGPGRRGPSRTAGCASGRRIPSTPRSPRRDSGAERRWRRCRRHRARRNSATARRTRLRRMRSIDDGPAARIRIDRRRHVELRLPHDAPRACRYLKFAMRVVVLLVEQPGGRVEVDEHVPVGGHGLGEIVLAVEDVMMTGFAVADDATGDLLRGTRGGGVDRDEHDLAVADGRTHFSRLLGATRLLLPGLAEIARIAKKVTGGQFSNRSLRGAAGPSLALNRFRARRLACWTQYRFCGRRVGSP